MQRCFSSIGCPDLNLEQIADLARDFGISLLELRSLDNTIELPRLLADSDGGWPAAAELLRQKNLKVQVFGSSFRLIGSKEGAWESLLEFAALAEAFGAPYLRAFAGGAWGEPLGAGEIRTAAENVRRWEEECQARGWKVEMLVETHDSFSASDPCLRLVEELGRPVGYLWDSHHTWKLGGESPSQTWQALRPYVRHVHIKDSVARTPGAKEFDYVVPGAGEMPLAEVTELLERDSYSGAVSLEWEKLWHPELPPLREALKAWCGTRR